MENACELYFYESVSQNISLETACSTLYKGAATFIVHH